jgi:SAM-dependent methyltransferase
MDIYKPDAKYYDLFGEEIFDYAAECEGLYEIFQRYGVRNIIDIACGTATHLIYLAQKGYDCVGSDASSEMLGVAEAKVKQKALAIPLIHSPVSDLTFQEQFDAVLCLHALSCFVEDAPVDGALMKANVLLRDGGIFIFDAINRDCDQSGPDPQFNLDMSERDGIKAVRLNSWSRKESIQFWDAVYLVEENRRFNMFIRHNKLAVFRRNDLEDRLQQCGFALQSVYSEIAGLREFHGNEYNMWMIARKQGKLKKD